MPFQNYKTTEKQTDAEGVKLIASSRFGVNRREANLQTIPKTNVMEKTTEISGDLILLLVVLGIAVAVFTVWVLSGSTTGEKMAGMIRSVFA